MAEKTLTIHVPGSTSNIGPGFDCLGMAVELYNDFEIEVGAAEAHDHIELLGTDGGSISPEGNPFFLAYDRIWTLVGATAPGVRVRVHQRVPMAAGLGSSATALVAGALAANHLAGQPLELGQIFEEILALEGHPDNVAAALYGGLALTAQAPGHSIVNIYKPARYWQLVVHLPEYDLETSKARKLLSKKVKRADAVFNLSRLPMLIDAIVQGDEALVGTVLADRLHEAERAEHVKRFGRLTQAAREAGAAGVFINGSGPSLGALCMGMPKAREVAKAMADVTEDAKFNAKTLIVAPAMQGAQISTLDD